MLIAPAPVVPTRDPFARRTPAPRVPPKLPGWLVVVPATPVIVITPVSVTTDPLSTGVFVLLPRPICTPFAAPLLEADVVPPVPVMLIAPPLIVWTVELPGCVPP